MTAQPARPHRLDTARRLRPLALPALAASAGVFVGGVPGFLLAFTAAVVAVDRALDFGGTRMIGADAAF